MTDTQAVVTCLTRLERIAKHFDRVANDARPDAAAVAAARARANTCWQSVGWLTKLASLIEREEAAKPPDV